MTLFGGHLPFPVPEGFEDMRRTIRAFLDKEVDAKYRHGSDEVSLDQNFYKRAAQAGLLGISLPLRHGGSEIDPLYYIMMAYELGRTAGVSSTGPVLQEDLVALMLVHGNADAHMRNWGAKIAAGEVRLAMALTEPGAGSDASGITTTAIRDGDSFVINGEKTYISNGTTAELVLVVCKSDTSGRKAGTSVLLVPRATPGFNCTRLRTMGSRAGDIAHLHFDNVRVPAENLIGEEGRGLALTLKMLDIDRLQLSALVLGASELAFEMTLDYVRNRMAFGQRILDMQNTQFKLAEMRTDLALARAFLKDCVEKFTNKAITNVDTAMAKYWFTEMEGRIMDTCLQLHGGAGYMDDMPISRLYTAARVHRIFIGTSEIMKLIIGRSL